MAAKPPLVSVLLPFYDDGSPELRSKFSEALSSILSQTFRDFEVVLVVSGRGDFARMQKKRSKKIRLFFFDQPHSNYRRIPLSEKVKGIVAAWNMCLKNARGKLLAFHAYDDISFPERLKTQVLFLKHHPEIGVLGSSMVMIDSSGKEIGLHNVFERDSDIRRRMVQFNPVPAPAVMAKASAVKKAGGFNSEQIPEDFDLWIRVARFTKFHNLRTPLVKYRVHEGGGVSIYRVPIFLNTMRLKFKAARLLHIPIGLPDIAVSLLQFISLFFPNNIRRVFFEHIRSKFVIEG